MLDVFSDTYTESMLFEALLNKAEEKAKIRRAVEVLSEMLIDTNKRENCKEEEDSVN